MKTLTCYLILLCLIFLMLPVNAQQHYLGIVGGLNISDFKLVNDAGVERAVDAQNLFGIGGVVGIRLGKNLYLHTEPLYLAKGGIAKADEYSNVDVEIKSSVLEVPVFLKFAFGENNRFHVMAGPSFGFNLSSKATFEQSGLTFEADMDDVMKTPDLAVAAGFGFSIPLGQLRFCLDGRYTYGLFDVLEDGVLEFKSGKIGVTTDTEGGKVFSRGFQFMAGMAFPLGGESYFFTVKNRE